MVTKKSTKTTARKRRGAAKSTKTISAYFLSLTVENVRCFGSPAQTLDLSDGNGAHARCTIIIGENGVGKTNVLQLLARSDGEILRCGYGATRRMNDGSPADEGDSCATLFSDEGRLINTDVWLRNLARRMNEAVRVSVLARKQFDWAKRVLTRLLPDVEDVRSGGRDSARSVEFKTSSGWLRLQDLSLGYRTFIAWIVDFIDHLFARYPDSPNPLAEPAVCLVDEIDLHLHPTWQRKIVGYLTELFPNTQFIVTAHSPLIVQAATDANIVVLRREGEAVVVNNSVASLKGWSVDQILTSELYGLASARAPEYDDVLAERQRLLSKAGLTARDKRRLRSLEAKVDELPVGDTPQDIKAFDLVRRFAADLESRGMNREAPAGGAAAKKTGKGGARGAKRLSPKKESAKRARAKR